MKTQSFACPYSRCRQSFKKPMMITDYSTLPRETYYVCPHCMLRLELLLESGSPNGSEHVHVQAATDETMLTSSLMNCSEGKMTFRESASSRHKAGSSKGCRRFLGYLHTHMETDIPDDCAVCPRIVVCYVKKE